MSELKILPDPTSCVDCGFHKEISDPDPHDWFCDDDCAIVCTKVENDKYDPKSEYAVDHQHFKPVTVSCRPYRTRVETSPIPKWCPIFKSPEVIP